MNEILDHVDINQISYETEAFSIVNTDRTFGTGIAVHYCNTLKRQKAENSSLTDGLYAIDLEKQRFVTENFITIKTIGNAGQSYGFVNCHGIHLSHTGPA